MVRLFFVEDEKVTRDSIRNNIDWEGNGICYAGEAPDGEAALPQILELKPDILLCDIQMPYIDGLELVRLVREKLPDIQIIILTGHDRFDYAQKAINLGINNFLLKPISSVDVLQAVLKIKERIEEKRVDTERSRVNAITAQAASKRIFMSELCTGALENTGDILARAKELDISLHAAAYQVLAVAEPSLRDDGEIEQREDYIRFCISGNRWIYLMKAGGERELDALAKRLLQEITARGEGECAYALGSVVHHLTHVSDSYFSAVFKMQRSKQETTDLKLEWQFDRDKLLAFLRSGTPDKIEPFWTLYLQPLQKALDSMIFQSYFYAELFFVFSQSEEEIGMPNEERLSCNMTPIYTLSNGGGSEKLQKFAMETCAKLMRARERRNPQSGSSVNMRAKDYIERHFGDPELSLKKVARAMNMSPSYFSTVFKEQTGCSFSQYLTDVRIACAKRLLQYSELRIGEIAARTGYENVNYFSVLFKKVTGMTPKQFREETEHATEVRL